MESRDDVHVELSQKNQCKSFQTQTQDLVKCILLLVLAFCFLLDFFNMKMKMFLLSSKQITLSCYMSGKGIFFFLPGVLSSTLTPFQLTQYTAALFVPSFHKSSNTTLPLSELCWHPVAAYIEIKRLLFACNSTNPPALTSLPSLW